MESFLIDEEFVDDDILMDLVDQDIEDHEDAEDDMLDGEGISDSEAIDIVMGEEDEECFDID